MVFKTKNAEIFYVKSGQGSPLIMLHGNGETHKIFDKAIILLQKYYTVYAIDTRGHGNSSFKGNELHYEDIMEDVQELINGLEIKPPIVYGFSDGGIVALMLAIKYPKLLSNIIISGVNINPNGIKTFWLWLFRFVYWITKSKNFKLMITEPNISYNMLERINIHVHITAGSRDMIKIKHMKNISNHITNSKFTIVKNEGHSSYIVNSEKIANIILEEKII